MGKTVTRVDLCEAVYQKVGLSRTESSAFVELVLKEINCTQKGPAYRPQSQDRHRGADFPAPSYGVQAVCDSEAAHQRTERRQRDASIG